MTSWLTDMVDVAVSARDATIRRLAHEYTLTIDLARDVLDVAEELGVEPDVAAQMHRRGLLRSAYIRHTVGGAVRLEPTLPGLDGWPSSRKAKDLADWYHEEEAINWLTDPLGPCFVKPKAARALLDVCEPGSAAQAALTAALWEAQDD